MHKLTTYETDKFLERKLLSNLTQEVLNNLTIVNSIKDTEFVAETSPMVKDPDGFSGKFYALFSSLQGPELPSEI